MFGSGTRTTTQSLSRMDSLWMEGEANQEAKIESTVETLFEPRPTQQIEITMTVNNESSKPERIIDLDMLTTKEQLYQYVCAFKSYEDIQYELKTIQTYMMNHICTPLKTDDLTTADFKKSLLKRLTRVFRWLLQARDTWPTVQPLGAPYER